MSRPVLLTLHLGPSDQALREYIRLEQPLPMNPLQRVICQDARYADLVFARWVTQKIAKGLPCGGGWHERYVPARFAADLDGLAVSREPQQEEQ